MPPQPAVEPPKKKSFLGKMMTPFTAPVKTMKSVASAGASAVSSLAGAGKSAVTTASSLAGTAS